MTTPAPPLSVSDLLFSSQSHDFNKVLNELKRSTLSLQNRLNSIQQDSQFVLSVAAAYHLPLIANERCGSWYIPPSHKSGSAYFKSTDGHTSQWAFSLRRLNLQVLDVLAEHGGCVIVDSTRRGKSMPDALSKTIPIWCAVLNAALFPAAFPDPGARLRTPPSVVSASEHAQIAARLPTFVASLASLDLDLSALRARVRKPLRPLWITQDSFLPSVVPTFEDFYPVVCCTASRRVSGTELSEGGYIQGAGDDAESWAYGLTPPLFWSHKDQLMRLSEEEMQAAIKNLVLTEGLGEGKGCRALKPSTWLGIGTIEDVERDTQPKSLVVTIADGENEGLRKSLGEKYLRLPCTAGKVGSRQLRNELPKLVNFLAAQLPRMVQSEETPRILVACPKGKDHSVGVALAILCLLSESDGTLKRLEKLDATSLGKMEGLNKQVIKQRLSWISVNCPDANPSRTTLQSINAFLLG